MLIGHEGIAFTPPHENSLIAICVGTARALAQLIDHKTNVNSKLTHYLAFNLWQWIKEYRQAFEPPVGDKVVSEDSQFTAMIIH